MKPLAGISSASRSTPIHSDQRDERGTLVAMLEPGDKAPELNLPDQNGSAVTLKAYEGRRVCVYFYPKADTPGCTQQSCLLRDLISDGTISDVAVIGISPDNSAKQKKFDDKYELGFPLLADTEHVVAEAFGVWKEKLLYGKKYMGIERSAFLIDEKGKIEKAWYKVSPKDTPAVLVEALSAKGGKIK
jgi:thioredoxin-dependent peroxiredoxin